MGRDIEPGEYGKVLEAIIKKYVCPVCRKSRDSQSEVLEHFFDNHNVEDLDSE